MLKKNTPNKIMGDIIDASLNSPTVLNLSYVLKEYNMKLLR